MSQSSIDYKRLEEKLEKKDKKAFKLSDVQHKIRKVAFDVVRFIDGFDIEGLWKVEKSEDGEYIVALYNDSEELEKTASTKSDWSTLFSKQKEIHVFYKGTPITRLAAKDLGVPEEDLSLVCSYLPEKLASNKKLVAGLLKELPSEENKELVRKYPELL